jgi:hypothetical protein
LSVGRRVAVAKLFSLGLVLLVLLLVFFKTFLKLFDLSLFLCELIRGSAWPFI